MAHQVRKCGNHGHPQEPESDSLEIQTEQVESDKEVKFNPEASELSQWN